MTVPSTARRAGPFLGNGSTTTFSFAFKTFAAGNLQVVKTSTIGVESVLVLASDYTVSLNPDQDASPGGTITYPVSGAPLATGEKLTVLSLLAYEQTTDLLGGGAFNARVIEDTFDRTVIQIQQLEERLDRALSLPTSSTANPVLPDPEATYLLAWNSAGTGVQNINPADLLTVAGSGGSKYKIFSGDASTTDFSLGVNPGTLANLEVSIGGVRQYPELDYVLLGSTFVRFLSAPPSGTNNILVRWAETYPVGSVSFGSVSPDKLTQPYTLLIGNSPIPSGGINFSVPNWAKRVTVLFEKVQTSSSADHVLVRIGGASSIASSSYYSGSTRTSLANVISFSEFVVAKANSYELSGSMVIEKTSNYFYVAKHLAMAPNPPSNYFLSQGVGQLNLGVALEQVQILSSSTFSSGRVSVSYE